MRRPAWFAAAVLLLAGCTLPAGGAAPAEPGSAAPPAAPATSSGAATPAPTPSPTPTAAPAELTLVATGDLLLHSRLWKQAGRDARGSDELDFVPLLAAVRPYTSAASLALCHMETPLAPEGGPYAGYPMFSSPPQIVDAVVELGYDACSTASNHTFDRGAAGVKRTLQRLDEAGVAHAGSARTERESRRTTLVEAIASDGSPVQVALLSYTYGFNGLPYPNGETWRANLIDEDAIVGDARTARDRGADLVVLSMHWGTEYQHEPDALQRRLVPRLAKRADLDLIVSHHAHVVQPIEKVGDLWVTYGHGNLVAAHRTPGKPNAEGLLTRWTFTRGADGRFTVTGAEYLPLLVTDPFPVRVIDVPRALEEGEYGTSSRARLREALRRTTRVVESRGADEDGLRPLAS
jgi:poly-gamma-glutamate synthesis protein (capsule biosynthesis protein)